MRGDFAPPPVVGDVDERPDECARGVASANGARRAVPAAKTTGRYRFGEGTFPRIPGNDGEAPVPDLPALTPERGSSDPSRLFTIGHCDALVAPEEPSLFKNATMCSAISSGCSKTM